MKIAVVYKWARDPEDAAVRNDGSIDWRGAKMAAGEDDPAAVAVACALAASGGSLVGLTIGDGDASWALARGVHEAFAVEDAPVLADNAATADVLAAAVRRIGEVDLVVIGDAEAYPGVASALAGHLGWPAILGLSTASLDRGRLVATRRIGGHDQTLSLGLPAVLAVSAASAEKQTPGMRDVLAARKRPVNRVPLGDLETHGLDRLTLRSSRAPDGGHARIFQGSPEVATRELVAVLRADGVL